MLRCADLCSLHPSVWMQYSQRSTHSLVLGSLKECCVLPRWGPNVWMGDLEFAHGLQPCERSCLVDGLNGCIYTREGTYQLHSLPSGPQFVGKFCGSYPAQAPCMGNLLICSQQFDAFILKKALKLQFYLVSPLWSMLTCTVSLWWFECPCRLCCCLSVTITKPLAWMAVLSFGQPSKFGWSACFHPTWKYGMGILFHMSVPACRCSRSQATCRPNPARKGGMMQHVPLGGQETHLQSHSASTCMMISWLWHWVLVPWSFEVLNMAVVQGIEVSRGNDHLLRHVTWWSRLHVHNNQPESTNAVGMPCLLDKSVPPPPFPLAKLLKPGSTEKKSKFQVTMLEFFITSQKSNSIHLFLLHLHLNNSKHVHPYISL